MAAIRHKATAVALATQPSDAAARKFAFLDADFRRRAEFAYAIFCRNVIIYFDGPTKIDLVGSHPGLDHIGRTTYRRVA